MQTSHSTLAPWRQSQTSDARPRESALSASSCCAQVDSPRPASSNTAARTRSPCVFVLPFAPSPLNPSLWSASKPSKRSPAARRSLRRAFVGVMPSTALPSSPAAQLVPLLLLPCASLSFISLPLSLSRACLHALRSTEQSISIDPHRAQSNRPFTHARSPLPPPLPLCPLPPLLPLLLPLLSAPVPLQRVQRALARVCVRNDPDRLHRHFRVHPSTKCRCEDAERRWARGARVRGRGRGECGGKDGCVEQRSAGGARTEADGWARARARRAAMERRMDAGSACRIADMHRTCARGFCRRLRDAAVHAGCCRGAARE